MRKMNFLTECVISRCRNHGCWCKYINISHSQCIEDQLRCKYVANYFFELYLWIIAPLYSTPYKIYRARPLPAQSGYGRRGRKCGNFCRV